VRARGLAAALVAVVSFGPAGCGGKSTPRPAGELRSQVSKAIAVQMVFGSAVGRDDVEADISLRNQSGIRTIDVLAVSVAPFSSGRIVGVSHTDIVPPGGHVRVGARVANAHFQLLPHAVTQFRIRSSYAAGACEHFRHVNPPVVITYRVEGGATQTVRVVPTGANDPLGWLASALFSCRDF